MDGMRLDKWLWVARFYKTRAIAADAVNGGKVHLNGERSKAGKTVVAGDELSIRKGCYEFVVRVIGLAKQRGPAKQAQLLYQEREDSIQAREQVRKQLQVETTTMPRTVGKPNKQTRRELIKYKKQHKE